MPSPTLASTQRTWELRPQSSEIAESLERETSLGPAAARVMAARGWDDIAALTDFLTGGLSTLSDPLELPDMEIAVARLQRAIESGETICICGDYDVDGTTGTALMLRALRWLGVEDVRHDTPHRVRDGYGIRPEAVDRLADEGVKLIVTVDNGTTARAALERARERGIDVIVTDHHQVEEALPPAVAVVNPWRPESQCSFPDLCGCALAFKLAQALIKSMGRTPEEAKPFLCSLLDLVAVATVADIMPLRGENRAIVRYALKNLADSQIVGLRALIAAAGVRDRLTADSFGWVLGPRLNAAGRTRHAAIAVDLLSTEDAAHAEHIAHQLEKLNTERRRIEETIREQAFEEIAKHADDPVVVLARPDWHIGVLGIVASRVLERVERPVILLTIEGEEARGSGRSMPGFNMHAALTACSEHLDSFGGHPMAAGLHCRADRIGAFRAAIIAHAVALGPEALQPRSHLIDTELTGEELTPALIQDLAQLEPFGEGHPRPLFALRNVSLAATPKVLKQRHLKFQLQTETGRSITGLAWGIADRLGELLPSPRRMDVLARPQLNAWNGYRTVEIVITDWRVTEP
jgi:single-stranded-DNA-specific exonuclease